MTHVHSLIVFTHLLCTCVALGLTLYTDFRMMRERGQVMTPASIEFLGEVKLAVTLALVGLWITGGLLITLLYQSQGVAMFENQKLFTKIGLVVLLTLNGMALHRFAIPTMLKARTSFQDMPTPAQLPLLLMSTFSLASWTYIAFLGIARQLNVGASWLSIAIGFVIWWATALTGALIVTHKTVNKAKLDRSSSRQAKAAV